MKRSVILLAVVSGTLFAQSSTSGVGASVSSAPSVSGPNAPPRQAASGAPVLGYFTQGVVSSPQLVPVLGTAAKPALGVPVTLPSGVSRIYLPPRQQYAFLQAGPREPLAIVTLNGASITARPGLLPPTAIANPDLVVFSPRGDAAVLYTRANARVQTIAHLPGEPTILRDIRAEVAGDIGQLAVSDDGALVVAASTTSIVSILQTGRDTSWKAVNGGFAPGAWTFIPGTHSLVISDPVQGVVVVLPNPDLPHDAPHILANQPGRIDRLCITKEGDSLLLASSAEGTVARLSLADQTLVPLKITATQNDHIDQFVGLRDGRSFLLNSKTLTVVQLGETGSTVATTANVRSTQ